MASNTTNVSARVVRILTFGVIVGLITSLATVLFIESIRFLFEQFFASHITHLSFTPHLSLLILVLPVIGGLLTGWLLYRRAGDKYHTVVDLIETTQIGNKGLPLVSNIKNSMAAIVSMASGASVGPYGPLVTMGGYFGARLCRVSKTDRNLGIGCGVAAAIATAFNAPLAGIVFAHEVILRHYSLRAFAPITVSASAGFFLSYYWLERPALLEMTAARSIFAPELIGFVIVGICGALVATFLMRAIQRASRYARSCGLPPVWRPAVAGLMVGVVAQWIPEILGVGLATQKTVIAGSLFSIPEMGVLMIAKILATALCIGFGFAGGVFSPALLIGLLMGEILGASVDWMLPGLSSGPVFYAICGMMAVTSPVIGAPLTAILIVFELTHSYDLTTAVMISVVFSNVVAYRLFGRSLFDVQLREKGIDLSLGRDPVVLKRTSLKPFIETKYVQLNVTHTISDAISRLSVAQMNEGYLTDDQGRLRGKIRLVDLLDHRFSADDCVERVTWMNTISFTEGTSVWDAMEKIRHTTVESIPIVDYNRCITGIIRPESVVNAYLETIHNLRSEEHASD